MFWYWEDVLEKLVIALGIYLLANAFIVPPRRYFREVRYIMRKTF